MTPGTSFAIQGVTRHFGPVHVLRGIDLVVPQGQFLAVIGKSGCGKSTLLRLLAGLDKPTSGNILRNAAVQERAGTRIMFQEPRLLPWARVSANVAVGLTGLPLRAEGESRTAAILEEVGLGARGGDWPSTLSGGQRQRVALARALIGAPSLLALDEPLGALDALTRIEMQQLLERVWLEKRFTAVLVTHDVSEAVVLADRVVVLDAGKIALDLAIDLPRPRRRGAAEIASFEQTILGQLFNAASSEAAAL
ncbi:MAG: ATP-binding cassette domain-containing protein [Aestuariivirga sp.]